MTQILKTKQLSFGITGDSHTLVGDIPLFDEKTGEVASPRSTSPRPADISQEIMLNTAAGCRRNPPLPVVSLLQVERVSPARSAADSKEGLSQEAASDLITEFGNFGKLAESTKVAALHQVVPDKPSTSANLASSNAAGGNNRLKPSLYTLPAVKTGIYGTTALYNRFLGGLTFGRGQLRTLLLKGNGINPFLKEHYGEFYGK